MLVWRKSIVNSRIGERIGPLKIEGINEQSKIDFVRDKRNSAAFPFNKVQIKPYYTEEVLLFSFILYVTGYSNQYTLPKAEEDTFMTEIISSPDIFAMKKEMTEAKYKEIQDFLKIGTFKTVLKEGIPTNANVIPGRFVLAIQYGSDGSSYGWGEEGEGRGEELKDFMIHLDQTLQAQSI